MGLAHYPTLSRQQILDLIERLNLCDVPLHDWADTEPDPMDQVRLTTLGGVLERYPSKAQGLPDQVEIVEQGKAPRLQLHATGAQDEPRIAIIGRKP